MIEIQPKDTSRGHFYVSLAKSFLRIVAGVAFILASTDPELMTKFIGTGGLLLVLAEVLGIVEELV